LILSMDTSGEPPEEDAMAKTEDGRIVETAREARQAEPGPSILLVLTVSLTAVIFILALVWLIFFKT
jgi:hypothetical protein